MVFNLIAVALSALALVSSTFLAFHQVIVMKRSTHLPAYLTFLNEFRSLEFQDRYRYVCDRLRAEHDPQLGISGLPDDARRAVYDVAYFFQNFAALRRLQILDGQMIETINFRFILVWDAIAPFVVQERTTINAPGYKLLRILENFANEARTMPAPVNSRMHGRRRGEQ